MKGRFRDDTWLGSTERFRKRTLLPKSVIGTVKLDAGFVPDPAFETYWEACPLSGCLPTIGYDRHEGA